MHPRGEQPKGTLTNEPPTTIKVEAIVKQFRYWWSSHFLGLEFLVVVLAALGVYFWFELSDVGQSLAIQMADSHALGVYRTLATVGVALAGFTMTVVSLVLTRVRSDERYERLRESSHFTDLRRIYMQAIAFSGSLALFSIVAMVVDIDKTEPPQPWMIGLLTFFTFASSARIARAVWVLNKLLKTDEPTRLDRFLSR